MSASAFLDKYFECVDSLPQDLQRYVSQLREIELEKRGLFLETERLRGELVKAVSSGSKRQMILFRQLQECLLEVREVGNRKLEVSAEMLDTVEDYTQQLGLCAKEFESNPRGDDLYHTPRHTSIYHHTNIKGESPMSNGFAETKGSMVKRASSSTKRPRQPVAMGDKGHDEDHHHHHHHHHHQILSNGGEGVGKEGSGSGHRTVRESGLSMLALAGGGMAGGGSGSGGSGGSNGGSSGNSKPPKKKVKTVKKSTKVTVTKDKDTSSAPTPSNIPMPDLTSQPLDPDEPTYCLCQQVSFGEMIGCDNEDCEIEWFHFQCVGLVSKPKGKWYCPRCTQERKSKSTK